MGSAHAGAPAGQEARDAGARDREQQRHAGDALHAAARAGAQLVREHVAAAGAGAGHRCCRRRRHTERPRRGEQGFHRGQARQRRAVGRLRAARADADLRRRRAPGLQPGARPRRTAAGRGSTQRDHASGDRRPRQQAEALLGGAGDPRRGPAGRPAGPAAPAAHPGRQRRRARLGRGLAGRADEGGRGNDLAPAGADRHRPPRAQPARDRVQAGHAEAQPRRGQGRAQEHGHDLHRPARARWPTAPASTTTASPATRPRSRTPPTCPRSPTSSAR